MNKSPDLAGALEAMKSVQRGPRRKSPVYEWLAARHDQLAAAFRDSQPSWKALAEYLGKGGVLGANGVPATAAAVRSTWLRVQADKERKRARTSQTIQAAPPPSAIRESIPPADPGIDPDADDETSLMNSFVKERR